MGAQDDLTSDTSINGRCLEFNFPSLLIGTAEYPQGPTGTTVFRFANKAIGAVDVRGGAPSAYNVDWLRLGHSWPNLDAVVISGGSWYGLGAAAGVSAALKEDGQCSGDWTNLANVAGAIVYDFGARRPNEIHPDERLGAAALRAARPGCFPLGAQGAGRMVMQGSYFGLWPHSGQGGAFRQIGETKIACFAVVNAVGAVVDRSGRVACGNQQLRSGEETVQGLLALVPHEVRTDNHSIVGQRVRADPNPSNTTISLVVINQVMTFADLQRLAIQIHMSMGRAIQPFATAKDGDVLFAVSTAEIENPELHPTDIATMASELMWDALLSSVPDIPPSGNAEPTPTSKLRPADCTGHYQFGSDVVIEVTADGDRVDLRVKGPWPVFGVPPMEVMAADLAERGAFDLPGLYLTGGRFHATGGSRVGELILNPGPWQQRGKRA